MSYYVDRLFKSIDERDLDTDGMVTEVLAFIAGHYLADSTDAPMRSAAREALKRLAAADEKELE